MVISRYINEIIHQSIPTGASVCVSDSSDLRPTFWQETIHFCLLCPCFYGDFIMSEMHIKAQTPILLGPVIKAVCGVISD